MTLRAFPTGLDCPIFKSDKHRIDGGLETNVMESGFMASRRLYDHLPGDYEARYRVSASQADLIIMFADTVGAGEFEIKARLPGQLRHGYSTHVAKFREFPQIEQIGIGAYEATVKVRIMNMAVDSYDSLSVTATYGEDALIIVNAFDQLANTDMPQHVGAS
ncbi:MAG: hypothetical protein QNI84_13440 [Henriciella sp.]|nr:hypothetical protein [Henriciella sp.]